MLSFLVMSIPHTVVLWTYALVLLFMLVKRYKLGVIIMSGLIALDTFWNLSFGTGDNLYHSAIDLIIIGGVLSLFLWSKDSLVKVLVLISGTVGFFLFHIHQPVIVSEIVAKDSVELLVQFEDKASLERWLDKNQTDCKVTYPLFHPEDDSFLLDEYLMLHCSSSELTSISAKLSDQNSIHHVEINEVITVPELLLCDYKEMAYAAEINDPHLGKQWMADPYKLDEFHKLASKNKVQAANAADAQFSVIAILDTGIEGTHEDLKDNYLSTVKRYDSDGKGHGTHCAGIAAAVTGNNLGIASLIPPGAPVRVTSIKVLNNFGAGTQKSIIDGIILAADKGYEVISLSLGGISSDKKQKAYNEAVKYANDKGCIVVVAAGNSGNDARNYSPANSEGVITVTAIDTLMRKAAFGNDVSGLQMGIAAPGTAIFSTIPGNEYKAYNGTSMSAPLVAGLLGLMKAYDKNLDTAEAYRIIEDTAIEEDGLLILNPLGVLQKFFDSRLSS